MWGTFAYPIYVAFNGSTAIVTEEQMLPADGKPYRVADFIFTHSMVGGTVTFEIFSIPQNGHGVYYGISNLKWLQCDTADLIDNLHCGEKDESFKITDDECTKNEEVNERSPPASFGEGDSNVKCW